MSRRAVLVAGLMAGLSAMAQAADPSPPVDAATDVFVAPQGPLILTRTLRRGLADGKEIVSSRRYEVRIVADGAGESGGFRVDGRLLDSTVEAPPSLAALAEIERKRGDAGLFPFRLDARGMIVSRAASNDPATPGQVGEAARKMIAASPLGPSDRQLSETIAGRILSRGAGSGGQWPSDLFRPVPGQHSQTSPTLLPDGAAGSITTTIETRRGTPEAPGDTIERIVTTETGGNRRVSRELYRVEPGGR